MHRDQVGRRFIVESTLFADDSGPGLGFRCPKDAHPKHLGADHIRVLLPHAQETPGSISAQPGPASVRAAGRARLLGLAGEVMTQRATKNTLSTLNKMP